MTRHKNIGFGAMINPWIDFLKKFISFKVTDSRRMIKDRPSLSIPMFPSEYHAQHFQQLRERNALEIKEPLPERKSLKGKYGKIEEANEASSEADNTQQKRLPSELHSFDSLEVKFNIVQRFTTPNPYVRSNLPKFVRYVDSLIPPVVINAESTLVNLNFSIDRSKCRMFDSKQMISEFILQLYCYEESDPYQRLVWPEGMCSEINSFEIPIKQDSSSKRTYDDFYISKNHPPTISGYLKLHTNLINLKFKSRRSNNYVIDLRVVSLLSRSKAYDIVLAKNSAPLMWDFTMPRYLECCYLSKKTMETPIRGKHCSHKEVL